MSTSATSSCAILSNRFVSVSVRVVSSMTLSLPVLLLGKPEHHNQIDVQLSVFGDSLRQAYLVDFCFLRAAGCKIAAIFIILLLCDLK